MRTLGARTNVGTGEWIFNRNCKYCDYQISRREGDAVPAIVQNTGLSRWVYAWAFQGCQLHNRERAAHARENYVNGNNIIFFTWHSTYANGGSSLLVSTHVQTWWAKIFAARVCNVALKHLSPTLKSKSSNSGGIMGDKWPRLHMCGHGEQGPPSYNHTGHRSMHCQCMFYLCCSTSVLSTIL